MRTLRTSFLATTATIALAGSAYAADLQVKAPIMPPLPVSTWQGAYIGGSVGVARANLTGNQTSNNTDGAYGACAQGDGSSNGIGSCASGASGFTIGGQIGYDLQSRYFVYGVVADWSWTSVNHTVQNHLSSIGFIRTKIDWLASFRGRMGLAVDDTLIYFTGGLAVAGIKSGAGQIGGCPFYCYDNALSGAKVGWVAGLGAEHKIMNSNLSVFAEALYYDFGLSSATSSSPDGSSTYTTEFSHELFTAKIGVNYRF